MEIAVTEAKELEVVAEKNNCKVMVGFMKRFSPKSKIHFVNTLLLRNKNFIYKEK